MIHSPNSVSPSLGPFCFLMFFSPFASLTVKSSIGRERKDPTLKLSRGSHIANNDLTVLTLLPQGSRYVGVIGDPTLFNILADLFDTAQVRYDTKSRLAFRCAGMRKQKKTMQK